MIADLPNATTKAVSKQLVRLRNESGSMTLGRVMTLIVVVDEADADEAIEAAITASRQHPSRIIALVSGNPRAARRLDAQVRLGSDAGGSEIIVLRMYGELTKHGASVVTPLLAADTPIVAWWPSGAQDVGSSPIGKLAGRRITDASLSNDPRKALQRRRVEYTDGDTDMAWSRTTRWRGLLATALDLPPYEPVTSVTVTGASDSASTDLLAGWLAVRLKCPVRRARSKPGTGLVNVVMERKSGAIELVRPDRQVGCLTQPGQPERQLDLTRPDRTESLAEELSRLGGDEVYRQALVKGLPLVTNAPASKRSTAKTGAKIVAATKATTKTTTKTTGAKTAAATKAATKPTGAKTSAKKVVATKTGARKAGAKKAAAKKAAK